MTTARNCSICGGLFAVSGDNLLPPHYCTDPQTRLRDRRARLDAFAGRALQGLIHRGYVESGPAKACELAAALLAARDAQDATGGAR